MICEILVVGPLAVNCIILGCEVTREGVVVDAGGDADLIIAEIERLRLNIGQIINTHGHFDHVWSNQELKEKLSIPLYTPKDDVFLLQSSTWMSDLPPSYPDVEVNGDEEFDFDGVKVKFRHFPGHCPGCSTIEIEDAMFSGDFIFDRSIGRTDFPYSNPEDMKKSLTKFKTISYDKQVFPGHGGSTTIFDEQKNVDYWMKTL